MKTYNTNRSCCAKEGYRARYESLNALPKIVFSSTLQEPLGWSKSTVISEAAVTAMARQRISTHQRMKEPL